jgi:hypothetical protein
MSPHLKKVLCVLVLLGGMRLIWEDAPVARAMACSSPEYQGDCGEAIEELNLYCYDVCWDTLQTFGYFDESVATCHWYGEDDPSTCVERFGDACSCFSGITGGACVCILV